VRDVTAFLSQQEEHYICKHCGGIINMHYAMCSDCGVQQEAGQKPAGV
jgi:ribosomal protein L37E